MTVQQDLWRTVYIAGPMTGVPQQNRPTFRATRKMLCSRGFNVIDPLGINMSFMGCAHPDQPVAAAPGLRADVLALLICDCICILPGWEHSRGARLEVAIAITLSLKFVDWQTGEIVPRPPEVTIRSGYGEDDPTARYAQSATAAPAGQIAPDALIEEQTRNTV